MNYVLKAVLVLCAVLQLVSCSKGNEKASNIDPRTGKHPAGWAVDAIGGAHPAAFLSGPSACYQCHGKDLSGGISQVSCFSAARSGISCHPAGPSGHPAGWAAADVHGAAAKALLSGQNGMPHCQLCHGSDFTGGIAKVSCLNTAGCHGAGIMAAHSPKPWRSTIGGRTHTSSDQSNASACVVCHANGSNSSRAPSPPAPAGTAPGCFNNTLCHGVEGHETGWNAPSAHGAAAKAPTGGDTGFATCTVCHGTQFNGGTAEQTCLNTAGCHGANVGSPHPVSPWRSTTGGFTHTTTDTSNAGQCAVCHTNGANSSRAPRAGDPTGSSGCFNNTLCHGAEGHVAGWAAAALHGAAAKSVPGTTTGFSSCQVCHGSTFNNGSARSCMNTLGCHGLLISSPHPEKPWTSTVAGASTHTTTDQANAGTCAICHTGGANSRVVPPSPATGTAGCYNNTLCHFHTIPFAPPAVDPSVHGGLAKQNLTVCQNCHGVKGTTSFNGLVLGNVTTVACSSCHTFAKAHPTAWQGSTTNPGETVIYSHRTAGNIANACSLCHYVAAVGAGPLAGAPSCFSTTFTNGLTQTGTCHASGPGVAPHTVPYPNHNATARSNFNYCLGCHQVDVDVTTPSIVIPRCQTCHLTSPVATPTGCTSCHAKPPAGNAYPNLAGVHASHAILNVAENINLTAVCEQCHNGLGFGTLDHLNRARARTAAVQANPVNFGTGTLSATGGLVPTYTAATQTCATTYCHGTSLASNTVTAPPPSVILAPAWNTPFPAGSHCNRCHGFPPVTASHASIPVATQCINCHPHVNANGDGFSDPTKHINGLIEASGAHAFPNPGSAHKSAVNGTGCRTASCHPADAAGSAYPVAVGTPPNCRACHLNASPSSGTRCSDCHGSTGNDGSGALLAGRPSSGGTTFPNRPGEHNRSDHVGRACTACHPFTVTSANHGWSNRTRSTAAQVGGVGTSINSWNPATKSCQPTCHGTETW